MRLQDIVGHYAFTHWEISLNNIIWVYKSWPNSILKYKSKRTKGFVLQILTIIQCIVHIISENSCGMLRRISETKLWTVHKFGTFLSSQPNSTTKLGQVNWLYHHPPSQTFRAWSWFSVGNLIFTKLEEIWRKNGSTGPPPPCEKIKYQIFHTRLASIP